MIGESPIEKSVHVYIVEGRDDQMRVLQNVEYLLMTVKLFVQNWFIVSCLLYQKVSYFVHIVDDRFHDTLYAHHFIEKGWIQWKDVERSAQIFHKDQKWCRENGLIPHMARSF